MNIKTYPLPPPLQLVLKYLEEFDTNNTSIIWYSENTFPGLSNSDAVSLGIVRSFSLNNRFEISTDIESSTGNPSLFEINETCGGSSNTTIETSPISTEFWDSYTLASDDNVHGLCAEGYLNTVQDNFTFKAIARKNPVTRDFANDLSLRMGASDKLYVSFQDCNTTPGWDYFSHQKDQLLVDTFDEEYCINDGLFDETTSRTELLTLLSNTLASTSNNVAFVFILSYVEEGDVTGFYESLDNIMESLISASNRVQGTIVYDSFVRDSQLDSELAKKIIWCPSIQEFNLQACNVLFPLEISGGPLSLGLQPVFPSYELYEEENDSSIWPEATSYDFYTVAMSSDIETYEEYAYFDELTGIEYWNYYYSDINDTTVVQVDDKLSYCESADITAKLGYYLPDNTQLGAQWGYLSALPAIELDQVNPTTIRLGLVAEYAYYMEYNYKQYAQAGIENIPGALPLSGAFNSSDFLGDADFTRTEFGADEALTICEKFCEHPIFNESGEYLLGQDFESYYSFACYSPKIPENN